MINTKTITIVISNSFPKVTFDGDYITKRELDIIIRVLKKEHRIKIREYRKKAIIEQYKLEKEKEKGNNNGQGNASSSTSGTESKSESGQESKPTGVSTSGNSKASSTVAGVGSKSGK
jgi:hypothetical protein